jgi:hypothetical protein
MALPDRLLAALRNLADKQAGAEVGWINITDARALTERGPAQRTPSSWTITAKGEAVIADVGVRLVIAPPPTRLSVIRSSANH